MESELLVDAGHERRLSIQQLVNSRVYVHACGRTIESGEFEIILVVTRLRLQEAAVELS
jgi:hypothetical protein